MVEHARGGCAHAGLSEGLGRERRRARLREVVGWGRRALSVAGQPLVPAVVVRREAPRERG